MANSISGSIQRMAVWLPALLLAALVACGSDAETAPQASNAGDADPVPILNPGSTYSLDDLAAAGWKQSKQLSADTLPNAAGVWYGFYDRKDVEVRIYASHDSALADGTGPADDATGRGKPKPFAEGGISSTRTAYGAYAVAGNLVLLCETAVTDCLALIDRLD